MLLLNRSPHLEDMGTGLFERARRERLLPAARGNTLHAMQRAVAELGVCDPPQRLTGRHSARASGGPPAWKAQVEHWHGTSALSPRVRDSLRATLLKVGRWVEAEQPQAADPASWTRQTCAAWVAAVDRMKVGDYLQRTAGLKDQVGNRPGPGRSPRSRDVLSAIPRASRPRGRGAGPRACRSRR
jgi:hypothetical protein